MAKVLVFFGMIASGKSYLASAWAAGRECLYCNSDRVRKELAGVLPESRQATGLEQGIYSREFTRRTYDQLIELAKQEVVREVNACVALDGSYQMRSEREKVVAALSPLARVMFVHCLCPEEVMRERMTERLADVQAVSDGRWEIYVQQKKKFEMPQELGPEQLITIQTNDSLDCLLRILDAQVDVRG